MAFLLIYLGPVKAQHFFPGLKDDVKQIVAHGTSK
jgi:hypothetical protein